ncbi:MAG: glycosyltransferase family 2 protein [Methylobacteriaceae bacterium]|nr:glycosyltransferase family 2 protein [Methylobacteriaceae bacterium]
MTIPVLPPLRAVPSLLGTFERAGELAFAGYALDPADPARRFAVDLLVDGEPAALVRADRFDRRLFAGGIGDGCHAFAWAGDPALLAGARQIEARLANDGTPVGRAIDLWRSPISKRARASRTGTVSWSSGLRLYGHALARHPSRAPLVRVREGGDLAAEARPLRWAPSRDAGLAPDLVPFSLHLPERFADGRVHRLTVEDESGVELEGSPLVMLAFPDGLARLLPSGPGALDGLRADWFDRLCPGSVPLADYAAWDAALPPEDVPLDRQGSLRVLLIGADGLEDAEAALRAQTQARWSAACVEAEDGAFLPEDLAEGALADLWQEDVVVLLRTATRLRPDALAALAWALRSAPDAVAAYGDLEVERDGGADPMFFGAFDVERQLEQGYAAQVLAVRIEALRAALTLRPTSLERLCLALLEVTPDGTDRILHRPGIVGRILPPTPADAARVAAASIAHLAAREVAAEAVAGAGSALPAVRVRRAPEPGLVSIVISTRNRHDLLAPCLDSIRARTEADRYEIVLVDNGSSEPETLDLLSDLRLQGVRVVSSPGPFNYAQLNNRGVEAARGPLVCLLNNDTEILGPGWLDELASRITEPDVGAVGAVLRWPNGMVQHGGIVLGPGFSAADAFNDQLATDPGHGDLLRVAREASAATAACLLVRRADYQALGGFDEVAFPVLFNDVDFCLRLRAAGRRVVVTPYVEILHRESASRGRDEGPAQAARYRRELTELRRRWGAALAADPAYNPFLNTDPYPFSALAARPRDPKPRFRTLP